MDERIQGFIEETNRKCNDEDFIKRFKDITSLLKESDDLNKELNLHKALSNNLRLLIYNLLKEEGLCTCVLSAILDKPEGSLSHHIKILENAGLIIGQRKGRFTMYYTKENLIKELT